MVDSSRSYVTVDIIKFFRSPQMAKAQINTININKLVDWNNFNPNNPNYQQYMKESFDWIKDNVNNTDLKNQTIAWFKLNNRKNDAKALDTLSDWRFMTVGKYYWMLNKGATLSPSTKIWLDEKINSMIALGYENLKEKEANSNKPIISEPSVEFLGRIIAQDLEDLILDGSFQADSNTAYELLKKRAPKPTVLLRTIDVLKEYVTDHQSMTQEEIIDGFGSKKRFRDIADQYIELLKVAETFKQNVKITKRANGKTKTISGKVRKTRVSKAVEKVSYKKEDHELKLVSINPTQIIGAKSILVFNTKNRRIGVYHSATTDGLQIRGTTIHNFDEEKSIQKILRNPKEQIEPFRTATLKRAQIVLNDYIKAQASKLNGRLNEHTIILKAWS